MGHFLDNHDATAVAVNPSYKGKFLDDEPKPFIGGLVGEGLDAAFNREPAAIRERIRTLGNTGNIDEANKAADAAYQNPSSSESFTDENTRKKQQELDSSSVSKLPEGPQTAARYYSTLFPRGMGMISDFLTNPGQLGLTVATEGASKALSPLEVKGLTLGERANNLPISKFLASSEGQTAKAADLSAKAISKTESLLQPGAGFSKRIKSGGTSNMVEQASKYISPAKNYTDVVDQMELAKGFPAEERQNVYDSTASNSERSQLDNLQNLIDEHSNSPQADTPQGRKNIKVLKDIHTSEVNDLNNEDPSKLNDPNYLQKKKAYYQSLANDAGSYRTNPSDSVKAEAYKALAQGYQDKTYALNEAVKPLNAEYSGLDEASTRSADLAAAERGSPPRNLPQEVIDKVHPSTEGLVKGALHFGRKLVTGDYFDTVPSLTRGINEASNSAEKADSLANFIDSIKSNRRFSGPDVGVLEYPKQLPAPEPKGLPGPEDFRGRDIKSGKLLQNQANSKKTINMTGPSPTINMPETLDSDIQKLAEKWGVPERNVRSSIKANDIEPVDRGKPQEGIIMGPQRRKQVFDILKRRKNNFQ